MDLYIKNTKFETVAVIDSASSVIWTKRYNTIGDFEIEISAGSLYIQYFKVNYYIYRLGIEEVGIIESVLRKQDEENGDYYLITGRFLESILDRRIVWGQTIFTNWTVEDAIRGFINQNVINPERTLRKIENFVLGNRRGYDEDLITIQRTGTQLDELVSDLCATYDYGFKVTLNNLNQFVFNLYKGIDRSYAQTMNPYVVFSEEFDNLLANEYIYSLKDFKNVNLVAGEGEGKARKTIVVGKKMIYVNVNGEQVGDVELSDLARREMYTDARDVSSNEGEISDADYYKQLVARGNDSLVQITELFDAEVELGTTYKYKEDFNVGDIITVKSDEWGIYINTRLIAMTESESAEGYKLIPTFANQKEV